MPKLEQVNLVVRDVAAMAAFYGRLGVTFEEMPGEWAAHHRNGSLDGMDVGLDSVPFAAQWNAGSTGPGVLLGFRVEDRAAVDRLHDELVAGGATSQQEPYDASWGVRFAAVADPDGNAIGIMSPVDPALRSRPTLPD